RTGARPDHRSRQPHGTTQGGYRLPLHADGPSLSRGRAAMNTQRIVGLTGLVLMLAACGGHDQDSASSGQKVRAPNLGTGSESKALYYRNPMNAAITSPIPAKDNMGMDYIPVYADQAGSAVRVSPTVE